MYQPDTIHTFSGTTSTTTTTISTIVVLSKSTQLQYIQLLHEDPRVLSSFSHSLKSPTQHNSTSSYTSGTCTTCIFSNTHSGNHKINRHYRAILNEAPRLYVLPVSVAVVRMMIATNMPTSTKAYHSSTRHGIRISRNASNGTIILLLLHTRPKSRDQTTWPLHTTSTRHADECRANKPRVCHAISAISLPTTSLSTCSYAYASPPGIHGSSNAHTSCISTCSAPQTIAPSAPGHADAIGHRLPWILSSNTDTICSG